MTMGALALSASRLTISTGRVPPCSEPEMGSKFAWYTSPRNIQVPIKSRSESSITSASLVANCSASRKASR